MKRAQAFLSSVLFLATCVALPHAATAQRDFSSNPARQFSELEFRKLQAFEDRAVGYIESIEEGPGGFMWFGTTQGLHRYDGYRLKEFKNKPDDPKSLVSDLVRVVFADSKGRLWIGTHKGISRFEPNTESFENFPRDGDAPNASLGHRVNVIIEDADGQVIAACESGYIFRYDEAQDQFNRINLTPFGLIKSMICDSIGRIWIGDENGISCFDEENRKISFFRTTQGQEDGVINDFTNALFFQSEERIWIGTTSDGAALLNSLTGEITLFSDTLVGERNVTQIEELPDGSIAVVSNGSVVFYSPAGDFLYRVSNHGKNGDVPAIGITELMTDRSGNFWLGSQFHGVGISTMRKDFENIPFHLRNPKAEPGSPVAAMLKDSSGNLWIGDSRSGLDLYPADGSAAIRFENDPADPNSVTVQPILKIFEDSRGDIWIGSFRGGLMRYLPQSRSFYHYKADPADPSSIASQDVRDFAEDEHGNLWVNTHGGGIDYLDISTDSFTHYRTDPHSAEPSILDDWSTCLLYDNQHQLWIGSPQGVSIIDTRTQKIRNYRSDPNDASSLASPIVADIFQDSAGRIWIGTDGGLHRYDPVADGFQRFTTEDGLSHRSVESIVEDNDGNLWVGTAQGLNKFDPKTRTFRNYFASDGIAGDDFFIGSAFKDANGTLYFGHVRGVTRFNPAEIVDNTIPPQVRITDLLVSNSSLPIVPNSEEPGELSQSILNTDLVTLTPQQKVLSLQFIGLGYIQSSKNKYSYKLEGFDADWSEPSLKRSVTYTNLNPGDYTFRVKASNNDGVWSPDGASLALRILPPFWETLWFRGVTLAALIAIPSLLVYWKNRRERAAKLRLEEAVAARTSELNATHLKLENAYHEILAYQEGLEKTVRERTAELEVAKTAAERSDRLKSAFLANMSHEIRTPMNAIVGFLHFLENDDLPPEERSRLRDIINKSSATLLALIDDILDLSTIEAGEADIEYGPVNLRELCEELHSMLQDSAKSQSDSTLVLEFDPRQLPDELAEAEVETDPLRVKQVLSNLITNAIKFTDEGSIVLRCMIRYDSERPEDARIVFTVRDSGIGIPEDQLPHIFERFHKIEKYHPKKVYRGTGLGLTISKKLVELMGGEMSVESELGVGTEFTVSLPYRPATTPGHASKRSAPSPSSGDIPDLSAHTVLVAEDEYPNFQYIRQTLEPTNIRIIWAENGADAIEIFHKETIDLVLLDIKMPKLDGHQTAQKIRQANAHVPIIVQSALAMVEDIERSLRSGANHHITKPFLPSQLLRVVQQHLPIAPS